MSMSDGSSITSATVSAMEKLSNNNNNFHAAGGGVPVARHRAKLEECARLHDELREVHASLRMAEQHVEGQRYEYQTVMDEASRLHDVLRIVTGELQTKTDRMNLLELENRQLRHELAELQKDSRYRDAARRGFTPVPPLPSSAAGTTTTTTAAAAAGVGAAALASITVAGVSSINGRPRSHGEWDPTRTGTPSAGRRVSSLVRMMLAEGASSSEISGSTAASAGASNTSSPARQPNSITGSTLYGTSTIVSDQAAAGENAKTSAEAIVPITPEDYNAILSEYTVGCFRTGCSPHPQVLHSIYRNDGRVLMIQPSVDFGQVNVVVSLLRTPKSVFALWASTNLQHLSLRCDDSHAGLSVLSAMLDHLPALRELEVSGIADHATMTRVAEALTLATQVAYLSLPELAIGDDGLEVLWKLLKQRELLATTTASSAASGGGSDSSLPAIPKRQPAGEEAAPEVVRRPLQILTLDLSACHIVESLVLKQLCCPGLEVLLLSSALALTDAGLHHILASCPKLHTLDLSGCTRITGGGLRFLNQHPNVVVLRAENCPLVKELELEHVEVLYSSLSYVMSLRMPNLHALPIPITHRAVLLNFSAPSLEQIALRGLVLDRHSLEPALMWSEAELRAKEECEAWDALMDEKMEEEEEAEAAVAVPPVEEAEVPCAEEPVEGGSIPGAVVVGGELPASLTGEAEAPPPPTIHQCVVANPVPLVELHPKPPPEEIVRRKLLERVPPPRLIIVTLEDCTITDPAELSQFLRQQSSILRLSLHNCRGVVDAHMECLHSDLLELDVGGVGSLGNAGLRSLVTRSPSLVRLNLKAAGAGISNEGIHALYGLTALSELNLLGLSPQSIHGPTIAAVVSSLPQISHLYHETAVVVEGGASATGRVAGDFLHTHRTDEESCWLAELRASPLELLRLRHHTSLSLWMEKVLPSTSTLLPVATARTVAAATAAASTALIYTPQPPSSWVCGASLTHPVGGLAALPVRPPAAVATASQTATGTGINFVEDAASDPIPAEHNAVGALRAMGDGSGDVVDGAGGTASPHSRRSSSSSQGTEAMLEAYARNEEDAMQEAIRQHRERVGKAGEDKDDDDSTSSTISEPRRNTNEDANNAATDKGAARNAGPRRPSTGSEGSVGPKPGEEEEPLGPWGDEEEGDALDLEPIQASTP